MGILSESWFWNFFSLVSTFVIILLTWMKRRHSYWQRRGLTTPPTTIFFGNGKKVFTQEESFADISVNVYNYLKTKKQSHGGFYLIFMPTYMPADPEIIKKIMQNDFSYFVNRGVYYNEEIDPLSAHLFAIRGSKWKDLRIKLTPTFTSSQMKMMFETLLKCSDELSIEMDKNVGKQSINIKDILGRFTTDIIGSCAFGIDCNSLKNPDNDFTKNMEIFFSKSPWENMIAFLTFVAPKLTRKFRVKAINPKCSKFFKKVIEDTVTYREKNNIYRKDFMHLLLQLKNRGKLVDDGKILNEEDNDKKDVSLSINEIAAQAFLFFLAGFETSSTTMTFCLFELASNPDVQQKLREEVKIVLGKHDNKLTYDAIMEMHYMEKVINETLRKYPPLPGLFRICTNDYKIPGTDVLIEKGTKVYIPVLGLHRDPEFYPEPEKFDPERFSKINKTKRHPFAFIPFGDGPRICLGQRFGMMQTKVGLSVLLKNYKFSLNSKTNLPVKLDPRSFILTTKGGIWLDYVQA